MRNAGNSGADRPEESMNIYHREAEKIMWQSAAQLLEFLRRIHSFFESFRVKSYVAPHIHSFFQHFRLKSYVLALVDRSPHSFLLKSGRKSYGSSPAHFLRHSFF